MAFVSSAFAYVAFFVLTWSAPAFLRTPPRSRVPGVELEALLTSCRGTRGTSDEHASAGTLEETCTSSLPLCDALRVSKRTNPDPARLRSQSYGEELLAPIRSRSLSNCFWSQSAFEDENCLRMRSGTVSKICYGCDAADPRLHQAAQASGGRTFEENLSLPLCGVTSKYGTNQTWHVVRSQSFNGEEPLVSGPTIAAVQPHCRQRRARALVPRDVNSSTGYETRFVITCWSQADQTHASASRQSTFSLEKDAKRVFEA